MKKVQRSEDHIEVLELDEVSHTANPNPRRSTQNHLRKLIINEDKKNEEEGNEAQGKVNEGEEAVDKETMEGENYEVINPNEENVTVIVTLRLMVMRSRMSKKRRLDLI